MGPLFARGRLAAPKPTSICQAREPPECAGGKRRPGRSPRHCCRSVICVTSFQGELWFDNLMRWAAGGGKKGGRDGDEAMSRNSKTRRPYDQEMVDDRNLGPLAIAFATILVVWMAVFGLVFVSAQIVAQSHNVADGSAPADTITAR